MILRRLKNSLAFRMPQFYRVLLTSFFKPLRYKSKSDLPLNLVILCGSQQLSMLQECLKSIYNSFERLPTIYIYTDKNLSKICCEKHVHWFPMEHLHVVSFAECLNFHKANGNYLIEEFAKTNPMGLKLASIYQTLHENKPVIYCDTDVLWYNDPIPYFDKLLSRSNFFITLSNDFQAAYDQHLIKERALDELRLPPYYCAGIMLIKCLPKSSEEPLQKLLEIASITSNHFTEQTIFAYLNKIYGGLNLDKDQFAIITEDQYNFFPLSHKSLIARHYIGPVRHLFWRDAFLSLLLTINQK